MASYTVGETLELGEDESGAETDIEENPEFPLPSLDTDSEE